MLQLDVLTFDPAAYVPLPSMMGSDMSEQILMLFTKYIGVLRDTARAPKPTMQYHAIPYDTMQLHV